jgi:hypothetical protein
MMLDELFEKTSQSFWQNLNGRRCKWMWHCAGLMDLM